MKLRFRAGFILSIFLFGFLSGCHKDRSNPLTDTSDKSTDNFASDGTWKGTLSGGNPITLSVFSNTALFVADFPTPGCYKNPTSDVLPYLPIVNNKFQELSLDTGLGPEVHGTFFSVNDASGTAVMNYDGCASNTTLSWMAKKNSNIAIGHVEVWHGTGVGCVSSAPSGINACQGPPCGFPCGNSIAYFKVGDSVTLTATPAPGYKFYRWGHQDGLPPSITIVVPQLVRFEVLFVPL